VFEFPGVNHIDNAHSSLTKRKQIGRGEGIDLDINVFQINENDLQPSTRIGAAPNQPFTVSNSLRKRGASMFNYMAGFSA